MQRGWGGFASVLEIAMAENKTKPTALSVDQYLADIADEARREDCVALANIMATATQQKAVMWGSAIVGFGTLKYPLANGRTGETCVVGFSSRKGDISIYGTASAPTHAELLARLGKHKMGQACLYISRLSDVNLAVLEQLIADAVRVS